MSCSMLSRVQIRLSVFQNAMKPKVHKNETTATKKQFTKKLSLLVLVPLCFEASSVSPPQRI